MAPGERVIVQWQGQDDALANGAHEDLRVVRVSSADASGDGCLTERLARAAVAAVTRERDASGSLPLLELDVPPDISPVFATRLTCAWLEEGGLGQTPSVLGDSTELAS